MTENLALTYTMLRNWEEAKRLYLIALEDRRNLGNCWKYVRKDMVCLIRICEETGDLEEMEEFQIAVEQSFEDERLEKIERGEPEEKEDFIVGNFGGDDLGDE